VSKVRVGFVGTGFMGQLAHLANYVVHKDICEVVAIAEGRPILEREVATRYGIAEVCGMHTELLKRSDIDAIVCVQPYANNINIVPDILRARKPVFTEKPIAVAPETGQAMADLAREMNTLYMVGYHKRSDPAMEYAKALVVEWQQTGQWGKMRYVRASMPPGDWVAGAGAWHIPQAEAWPSASPFEAMPGYFAPDVAAEFDAFVNYYIHQVNALRFLMGEPYTVTYAEPSGTLMGVESASGVAGMLEMAAYSTSVGWQESYLVCFEKGFIRVDLPSPLASLQPGKVTVQKDLGGQLVTESPVLPPVHAMRNQARNFILAVKGERPAPCEAGEAVQDLLVAKEYIRLKRGLSLG
jgi:predicted dehydrogenase